jgi:mxaC protein
MNFEYSWILFFLPLVILPWYVLPFETLEVRNLPIIPTDPTSKLLNLIIRITASLSIAALLLGFANPRSKESVIEKVGTGAEIVLLLDRSRSMDQPYGKVDPNRSLMLNLDTSRTKSVAARNVLSDFVKNRPSDFFGLINFSSRPIKIFPLTRKHDVIQKAISASTLGRSLAETDIAAVLTKGLDYFEDRPYTASRVVMLISDGGAQIDPITRQQIKDDALRLRISVYWIYLRGKGSPGIIDKDAQELKGYGAIPEFFLNEYFEGLGVPYKVYEASDPDQLKLALDDVNKLQKLPTRFTEIVAPQSFSNLAFFFSLIMLFPMVLTVFFEVSKWSNLKEKN